MKKKFLFTTVILAVAASLLSTPATWAATTAGSAVQVGSGQTDVAFSPDGSTAYVISPFAKTLTGIDIAGTTPPAVLVTFGSAPAGIAIRPDGAFAFVTLPSANVVAVINLDTGEYNTQISVGTSPTGVAFSPDGKLAYVTNTASGTVSIIDAVNNRATSTTITVSESPALVEFSPNGQVAYVGDYNSGQVSIIKTGDNSVTSLNVGLEPVKDIAFTPDSSKAYIANAYGLAVIKTATGTPYDSFDFQDLITAVAVSPDGSTVFFTKSYSKMMTSMNAATGVLGASFDTGVDPGALAVSPDGTRTLVTNAGDNFVSVFLHDPALSPPITSTSGSTASIAAGSLTASLTNAAFKELDFSHDAQKTTADVILSADDQTGLLSVWNVTLKASDMVWTSPGGSTDADRNIAARNLLVRSVTNLNPVATIDGDEFIGQAVSSDALLDSPTSVLFTESGTGSGSYTVPLTLALYVPANAATGTYQGTLTTTISAAP